MSKAIRAAAVLLLATTALSACGGDANDDPDTSPKESSMYCELIDPQTVAPIVGDAEVNVNGGPSKKDESGGRTVQCGLSEEGGSRLFLTVYETDFTSGYPAQDERDKAAAAMTKFAKADPEHYVALEGQGDDLGYATYTDKKIAGQDTGTIASGVLVTDKRMISVSALATPDQADEFVPLVLKVAQEFDKNLDAWDAENPS